MRYDYFIFYAKNSVSAYIKNNFLQTHTQTMDKKVFKYLPPPPDIDGMKLLQAYPQCQEVLSAPFSTQLFPFPMFTFPFTFTCIRQS